jgi:hypothetical protein
MLDYNEKLRQELTETLKWCNVDLANSFNQKMLDAGANIDKQTRCISQHMTKSLAEVQMKTFSQITTAFTRHDEGVK